MTENRKITSLQHPLVKHFVKLRTDKRYREEHQSIVVEGVKVLQEIPGMMKILYIPSHSSEILLLEGEKWEVTEPILQKISGMVSPEGVIAEVRMPRFSTIDAADRVLALDGVSEPGNLGTLLRSALAFGWTTICFLPDCCDPFNEKVIRAARGAHFYLSFVSLTAEQLQKWVSSHRIQSLVADVTGIRVEGVMPAVRRVLIVGNEAHGPSEVVKCFSQAVTLPMENAVESLNVAVAGGILLYLLRKAK